ncbi:MAG: RidA family protein [Saprospiraceae bacterium]|nr:RidA family protein [Saprospiraceae bacterium]
MKNKRDNYSSGTKWEEFAGYSRLVRIGHTIEVAGTTAVKDGEVLAVGDAAGQARIILRKIEYWLKQAGASLEDVVRTRMYVTNIEDWEAVALVHGEFFGNIRPASTLVGISALVDPNLLVEIEATAVLPIDS